MTTTLHITVVTSEICLKSHNNTALLCLSPPYAMDAEYTSTRTGTSYINSVTSALNRIWCLFFSCEKKHNSSALCKAVYLSGDLLFPLTRNALCCGSATHSKLTCGYWNSCFTTSIPCSLITTRSEEHTSELQSLMRISYAVFYLKKKINYITHFFNYF